MRCRYSCLLLQQRTLDRMLENPITKQSGDVVGFPNLQIPPAFLPHRGVALESLHRLVSIGPFDDTELVCPEQHTRTVRHGRGVSPSLRRTGPRASSCTPANNTAQHPRARSAATRPG